MVAVASIEERIQEVSESLSSKFTVIKQIAEDLIKAIGNSPVTSAELEFGLSATNVIFDFQDRLFQPLTHPSACVLSTVYQHLKIAAEVR